MTQWKNATPPHGKVVLAVTINESTGHRTIIRAHHLDAMTKECDYANVIYEPECDYDEETDTYYYAEGWYEQIAYWDELCSVAFYDPVIAWTELPPLPENQDDKT